MTADCRVWLLFNCNTYKVAFVSASLQLELYSKGLNRKKLHCTLSPQDTDEGVTLTMWF